MFDPRYIEEKARRMMPMDREALLAVFSDESIDSDEWAMLRDQECAVGFGLTALGRAVATYLQKTEGTSNG